MESIALVFGGCRLLASFPYFCFWFLCFFLLFLFLGDLRRRVPFKVKLCSRVTLYTWDHVTALNSSNNNVVFFFVSDLKIIYYKNY